MAWVAVFCFAASMVAGGSEPAQLPSPSSVTRTAGAVAAATGAVSDSILAIQKAYDRLEDGAVPEKTTATGANRIESSFNAGAVLRTVGGLALVIVLLLICAALAKRLLGPRLGMPGREMQLISSLPLSGKSKVHIIDAGGQRFLVGEGAGHLSLIAALGEAEQSPIQELQDIEPNPEGESFVSRFQAWQQQTGKPNVSSEVRASLLLIDGLCRRLRGKRPVEPDADRSPGGFR